MNFRERFILFLFLNLLYACSKSDDVAPPQPAHVFEVLEYKTNIPIAGAKVDLYTCTRYDAVFGCRTTGIFSSKITDAKGLCSFTNTEYKADEGVKVSKSGYWTREGGVKTYLQPEAFLNLHIKKQNNYPDTSYISIEISSEMGQVSFLSLKAPADSIINIKAFGNQNNNTKWTVFTRSSGCFNFCLADTLARGNFAKPLAKAETATYTLSY